MTEFSRECGYTDKNGTRRELTKQERKKLESLRKEFLESGNGFVSKNNARFKRFEDELAKVDSDQPDRKSYEEWVKDKYFSYFSVENHRSDTLLQVAFDKHQDYIDFLDFVWHEFGGARGIRFPLAPIKNSICVYPWLLRITLDKFPSMRPVNLEDFNKGSLRIVSPYPWDPADVDIIFDE